MSASFVGAEPPDVATLPQLPGSTIVDTYTYTDENGSMLYVVARYEPGPDGERKTFRQYTPSANGGKPWKALGDTRRVLYNLPAVLAYLAANRREPLYITEGEKDCHTLLKHNLAATTHAMGAGTWREEYTETLQGLRACVIVADRDIAGIPHAITVRAALATVGVTAEILLPREGCKDVTEHLESGYTLDQLEPLLEEPPPPGDTVFLTATEFLQLREPHIEPLIGTSQQAILAAGGLVILGGEAGTAKTTLTLDVLAHVCSGADWQGISQPRPLRVLVVENEGPRAKFKEKLEAKVATWTGGPFIQNLHIYAEPWGRFSFAEEEFRNDMTAHVRAHNIDLVVADPLGSLGIEGVGAPDETRRFVSILKGMGLFHPSDPVAYWFPHHYGKHHAGSVIQQLSGDWGGHADTVIGIRNEGKAKTHLTWAKVRWGSDLQGDKWVLTWTDGASYERVEDAERVAIPDAELWDRILAHLETQTEPLATSRIAKEVKGNQKRITELVRGAGDDGILVNDGTADRPRWILPQNTEPRQEEL